MRYLRSIVVAVFVLAVFTGCSDTIPAPDFDFQTTPKQIEQEANPVDLFEIMTGGPLFVLDTEVENPTLREYRRLRAARVDEMIDLMRQEREFLAETLEDMPEYREIMLGFLGRTAEMLNEKDPDQAKLKVFVLDTIDRYVEAVTKTTVAAANAMALAQSLDDAEDKSTSAWAMLKYSEYAALHELIGTITHELTFFPARSAGIVTVIRAKENKQRFDRKLRKTAKRFESDVEDFLEDIQGPFQEALSRNLDLGMGFESLEAADYAFMMAVVDFADTAIPTMESSVKRLRINDFTTEEDLGFYETYVAFMKASTGEMREGMKRFREPVFLQGLKAESGIIPPFIEGTAYANSLTDWLGKTASALTAPIKNAGAAAMGKATSCVTNPWKCTKQSFQQAQKGIGMAVDSVNLAVGTSMDIAANVYYGNSWEDAKKQAAGTMMTTFKAWDEGKPGATVLRTAKDYVDNFEKGVGSVVGETVNQAIGAVEWGLDKATGGTIKNVYGKETATWAANKLGEITTNMMTGAGKGLLALANPDSSKAELIEGAIDVAFAFTGGSKSVVKGSQTLKGTENLAKELTVKGTQQLEKLSVKLQQETLKGSTEKILTTAAKKLSPAEIQMIYANTKQIVANEAKEKLLKETEKSFGKILGESLEQGGKTVWGNLTKEVPEAFANFATKSYQTTIAGFKEMAGDIFGKNLGEWGNNVLGNMLDTEFKSAFIPLVAPNDKATIEKQEAMGAAMADVKTENPQAQAIMQQMMQQIAGAAAKIAMVEKAAEEASQQAAEQAAEAAVQEKILEKVEESTKEKEEELKKPVTATGSFSGDYRGSVTLHFAPFGGAVSGNVTTKYGTVSVNGSVKNASLSANVSGTLIYQESEKRGKEWVMVDKRCTLSARMSGKVGDGSASGTYSGSCAKEGDSGSWSVNW
jgi:hypothetical protein